MSQDIIREYLVSLAVEVDKKSADNAAKSLSGLEKLLNAFGKGITGNKMFRDFTKKFDDFFAKAAPKIETFLMTAKGGIITAVGAIGVAIAALGVILAGITAKFLADMAQADIQVQIFARRMFTSVENARSLKAVMDAMGLKDIDQLQDVGLNPELRKQFFELRKLTSGLQFNAGTEQGLKNIRAVGFEFQKISVVMNYFWSTFAGQLGKTLGGPLKDLQSFLSKVTSFAQDVLPGIAHDLAGVIGLVTKLFEIGLKIFTLFTGFDIGAHLKTWLDDFGAMLDIVNSVLDAINRVIDRVSSIPDLFSFGSERADNTRNKAVEGMAYHLRKIYELFSEVANFFLDLLRPIKDWIMSKVAAFNGVTQGVGNAVNPFFGGTASASTGGTSKGSLAWVNRDQSSKAIDSFLNVLQTKVNEKFNVTAGKTGVGHVSHGGGLAFDVGLAGKSNASIENLLKQVLTTPGLRVANLEVARDRYKTILADLDNQGVDYKGRIANDKSRFSRGDHLHVGLKPIKQNITINVHGVQDPKLVSQIVHQKIQENAALTTRNLQGSYQ